MTRHSLGVIVRNAPARVRSASCDDLARQLDAGGPGPDHHEGQAAFALGRIRGDLGGLERAQDAATQLQRVVDALHPGREGGVLVVAEVGLLGAGGHDQAVVGRHRFHAHQVGLDRLRGEVDGPDIAPQHPDVLLAAQDQPGGRRDVALGQDSGGHLIEQRLENVRGRFRDHGDVDVGALERLGRGQSAEAASDDDDTMARHACPFFTRGPGSQSSQRMSTVRRHPGERRGLREHRSAARDSPRGRKDAAERNPLNAIGSRDCRYVDARQGAARPLGPGVGADRQPREMPCVLQDPGRSRGGSATRVAAPAGHLLVFAIREG